jgi:hypothetical protein
MRPFSSSLEACFNESGLKSILDAAGFDIAARQTKTSYESFFGDFALIGNARQALLDVFRLKGASVGKLASDPNNT